MTPKQQAILAIGGVAAFVIVQKKKGATAAKTPAKGTPIAGGTGGSGSVAKPNTTNLATRNGTAVTPQAPSTISRIASGVSLGIADLAKLFGRSGQPVNARPADPGKTSPKGAGGGGGGAGGSVSTGRAGGSNVAGIPQDASPEYDSYGNLIGYDDGKTGEFVDLRTPAYDASGNEIGYYDADGNYAGESVPFDPSTPTTTDLPSMGTVGAGDGTGMHVDGSPSDDQPAIEVVNDEPGTSWFSPPSSDNSSVMIDSPADTIVVDAGSGGSDQWGGEGSSNTYPEPMYNPMDDANGDGLNTDDDFYA